MANRNLHHAKGNKNDEFYTQITNIEKELKYYKDQLKGKIVFCNCDDPEESNFFRYFALNFEVLGLKKLITTHFDYKKPTYKLEITEKLDENKDGKIDLQDAIKISLKQNGDFRSSESIEILKECDIVITNPPFSLFREYVSQLIEYDKKFLILGNMNAITYKEIFKFIQQNKIRAGYGFNESMVFKAPYENNLPANIKFCEGKGYFGKNYIKTPAINWYTNLEVTKRHEKLILYKKYNPIDYPRYDNYDGINVDKISDIPMDYDGAMGVPITFLDKYNPDQFEIIKFRKGDDEKDLIYTKDGKTKQPYFRILIKSKFNS